MFSKEVFSDRHQCSVVSSVKKASSLSHSKYAVSSETSSTITGVVH